MTTTKTPALLRNSDRNEVVPFDATTAHVVLHDGTAVRVDLDSLADLHQRSITGRWYSYANGTGRTYVAVHLPGTDAGTTTVATLITRRKPGEGVTYANGNRFDLRRANLIVVQRGTGRQRTMQAHAAVLFPDDHDAQVKWLAAEAKRRDAERPAHRAPTAAAAVTCGATHGI